MLASFEDVLVLSGTDNNNGFYILAKRMWGCREPSVGVWTEKMSKNSWSFV